MGINFQKVNFSYVRSNNKKVNALNNINLEISDNNSLITICGHTGSGKSTLIKLFNALHIASSGKSTYFGKDISYYKKKKKLKEIRRKVGLVFQFPEYQLFEENVEKEISFGPKNFKVDFDIDDIMKKVNLPNEYKSKSPFSLSGGEMKRVTIASIIAYSPELLILDEPTRGLDPKGKTQIMDLLKYLQEKLNIKIVVVTHDMNIISEYSQRVLVMSKSKLVYDGTPLDLFSSDLPKEYDLDYPETILLKNELKEKFNINIDKNIIMYDELLKLL